MKKFITLLLSFIMVFSIIPSIVGTSALAEDPPPTNEPTLYDNDFGTEISTSQPFSVNDITYIAKFYVSGNVHTAAVFNYDTGEVTDLRQGVKPEFNGGLGCENRADDFPNIAYESPFQFGGNASIDSGVSDPSLCNIGLPAANSGYRKIADWSVSFYEQEIPASIYRKDFTGKPEFITWKLDFDPETGPYNIECGSSLADLIHIIGTIYDLSDPDPVGMALDFASGLLSNDDGNPRAPLIYTGGPVDTKLYWYDYLISVDGGKQNFHVRRKVTYTWKNIVTTGTTYYILRDSHFVLPGNVVLPYGSEEQIDDQLFRNEYCFGYAEVNVSITSVANYLVQHYYAPFGYHEETYDNGCSDDICNICGTVRTGPHVHSYSDCTDTTCNYCDYVRVAPGHHFTDCMDTSCNDCPYVLPFVIGHHYTDCTDETCIDCDHDRGPASGLLVDGHYYDSCTDLECSRCPFERTSPSNHVFTDCMDTTCNNCPYTLSFALGHHYTDCTDTTCIDCNHVRTAPGHNLIYDWINVHTENICRTCVQSCTNCTYTNNTTDYSHSYSGCTDTTCDDCGYVRDDAPGHQFDDCMDASCNNCPYVMPSAPGHHYTDCTDTTCIDCNHVRTAPGHTYSPWTNISPSQHRRICSVCGDDPTEAHTYPSTWTDYTSASHKRTCSKCTAEQTEAHSYPSTWTYYSSSQHRHSCSVCGRYAYANHSYSSWTRFSSSQCKRMCGCLYAQYKDHSYDSCTDTTCNDCGYVRTAPGHQFDDCMDASCNNCPYVMPSAPGHHYSDCTDTTCIDCNHIRTAPGHTFSAWADYNSSLHRRTCSGCTAVQTQAHAYPSGWSYYTSSEHRHACTVCGHYATADHSYSSWSYYSSSQHRCKCSKCGDYNYKNHSYSSWSNYSSTQHRRKCTVCGHYFYGSHNWVYVGSGNIYRCSVCNATRGS